MPIQQEMTPPQADQMHLLAGTFPDFLCAACGSLIVGEPKCLTCQKCIVCCQCVHCERCFELTHAPCANCRSCTEVRNGRACCDCWVCGGCESRRQTGRFRKCTRCGLCAGHGGCCHCWECAGCHAWRTRADGAPCGNCARCLDCCQGCQGIRHLTVTTPTFHPGTIEGRAEHLSRRFVSAEIEVAGTGRRNNIHVARVVNKWRGGIVGDGSLPDGGFEINTAPAAGDAFVNQIEEIGEALRQDGAFATGVCGLHVHIDARDFRYYDMRRLIFLYEKIEDGLYGLAARSRSSNRYCVKCGRTFASGIKAGALPKDNKKSILTAIYQEEPSRQTKERKKHKYDGSRYNAMNLHSWQFRGTVECRIHQGSTDPNKIIGWGMMWAHILDYAMAAKESEVVALRGRPIDIICGILPQGTARSWVENRWAFFHRTRR
jgi:hypothetical protein